MRASRVMTRFSLLVAIAALAVLAFFAVGNVQKTEAIPGSPVCTFATPPLQLYQQGGGSDTVTCTLTVRGNPHTVVVDFTLTLGPLRITIDGCTLDGNVIHRGPCP